MEVLFAILADDMTLRRDDQRADIIGAIVEPVRIARFPAHFPLLQLHFVVAAQPEEQKVLHDVKLQVHGAQDETGSARQSLELDLSEDISPSGAPIFLTLTASFEDLSFPNPGRYEFRVLVDDVLLQTTQLVLVPLDMPF